MSPCDEQRLTPLVFVLWAIGVLLMLLGVFTGLLFLIAIGLIPFGLSHWFGRDPDYRWRA